MSPKYHYIKFMQSIGATLNTRGAYRSDRAAHYSNGMKYLLSLFAVYDTEKMIALDIPWWNIRTVRGVTRFLQTRAQARVFEYGSGASTVWLAQRAKSIISIEHDANFYRTMTQFSTAFPNITLVHTPSHPIDNPQNKFTSQKKGYLGLSFENYVRSIEAHGSFDLIVIDGRCRMKCFEYSLKHLNKGGMILFDDVHRRRYANALAFFQNKYDVQRIRDVTYCLPYPNTSALITPKSSTPN